MDFKISHERTVECPAAEMMLGKSPPQSAVDDNIVDGGMCYKAVYSQQYSAGPIRRDSDFIQTRQLWTFIHLCGQNEICDPRLSSHTQTHTFSVTHKSHQRDSKMSFKSP